MTTHRSPITDSGAIDHSGRHSRSLGIIPVLLCSLALAIGVGCHKEPFIKASDGNIQLYTSRVDLCEENLNDSGYGLCGYVRTNMSDGQGYYEGIYYEEGEMHNLADAIPMEILYLSIEKLASDGDLLAQGRVILEMKAIDFPIEFSLSGIADITEFYHDFLLAGDLYLMAFGETYSSELTSEFDGGASLEARVQFEPAD